MRPGRNSAFCFRGSEFPHHIDLRKVADDRRLVLEFIVEGPSALVVRRELTVGGG
jgi:hypothetical protein